MCSLSMKKNEPLMQFACVRKLFKKLDLTPKQSSYVFGLNVNSFYHMYLFV
jgi:hypothetical protein